MQHLRSVYLRERRAYGERAEAAWMAGDLEGLARAAHGLRPAASRMGDATLARLAAEVERGCAGQTHRDLGACVGRLVALTRAAPG